MQYGRESIIFPGCATFRTALGVVLVVLRWSWQRFIAAPSKIDKKR